MNIDIKTKIDRWREKAELFLDENIKCFIKTLDGGYHSADILFVGQNVLDIYDFIKKENFRIYWLDIILFEEYEESSKGNRGVKDENFTI